MRASPQHIASQAPRWYVSLGLLALPVTDVVATVYGSPFWRTQDGVAELGGLVAHVVSTIFFWAGLYLIGASTVRWFGATSNRAIKTILRFILFTALLGLLLYHSLLWAFILANGHPPALETLAFLRDNVAQIPAHVLQTAPAMVVGTVLTALVGAAFYTALIRSAAATGHATLPRIAIAQAAVLLGAWFLIIGVIGKDGAGSVFLDRDPLPIAQARADAVVAALPEKASGTTSSIEVARKVPVIVILVESLRHDLLDTHPEAIPFLRQMYDEHVGFDRAYATASHSNLSDLAFWYSQYPLRGPENSGYPPDAEWRGVSLFEVFKNAGYTTGYITSQNELWGGMINWLKKPAVDYFFDAESYEGDTWENADDEAGLIALVRQGIATAGKVEDSETLKIARQWIDSLEEDAPFFLGMNLQNTHFSYVMTPGAERPYQPSELGFRAVYYRWPEDQKERVRNRYLNSVRNVDELLGQFVEYLKQKGIWEDCVFVVLGDNGEAFYEHGFGNHSGPMYEEVVRTLAVMKLPDEQRIDISKPISHIDVAATVPQVVGLDLPWSFQGRSVFSDECDRPVFMFSNAIVGQFGVVDWPWKYLLTQYPNRREELYNLIEDPGETDNIADRFVEHSARLREDLEDWALVQERYYSNGAYANKLAPAHCDSPGRPARSQLVGLR